MSGQRRASPGWNRMRRRTKAGGAGSAQAALPTAAAAGLFLPVRELDPLDPLEQHRLLQPCRRTEPGHVRRRPPEQDQPMRAVDLQACRHRHGRVGAMRRQQGDQLADVLGALQRRAVA